MLWIMKLDPLLRPTTAPLAKNCLMRFAQFTLKNVQILKRFRQMLINSKDMKRAHFLDFMIEGFCDWRAISKVSQIKNSKRKNQ